jgi:hypothetical protein
MTCGVEGLHVNLLYMNTTGDLRQHLTDNRDGDIAPLSRTCRQRTHDITPVVGLGATRNKTDYH